MKLLIYLLLAIIGFSGCSKAEDNNTEKSCMYGTPYANFHLIARVVDEEGNPIKGIVVADGNSGDQIYGKYGSQKSATDENGELDIEIHCIDIPDKLLFRDVDGEENGGEFKDKHHIITIDELVQFEERDGWYIGGFQANLGDVVMKKEVSDEPILNYIPFDPAFVIVDEALTNIANTNPNWLLDLEIEYNGNTYRVDPEEFNPSTLAYPAGPAELRYDKYNQTFFIFGEFTMGEDGEFKVRYKEHEWHIRFDTNIMETGSTESTLYINDKEATLVKGAGGEDYVLQWFYQLVMQSNE